MFQNFISRLHLDFIQTSTLLQLLAKPELGTTPACLGILMAEGNKFKPNYGTAYDSDKEVSTTPMKIFLSLLWLLGK